MIKAVKYLLLLFAAHILYVFFAIIVLIVIGIF